MRILYYVSIAMHSPEELGSLAKPLLEIQKRIYGPNAEEIYREKINKYWEDIIRHLQKKELFTPEKCKKLHIYVDGLPQAEDCHVQKVVQELIKLKLPQYIIIEELLRKGAVICGTESRELLLEEHAMWKRVVEQGIDPDPKRKAELLQERDEFIAKRINQTLPENEIGILFIGAAHKVDDEVKKISDIEIVYL